MTTFFHWKASRAVNEMVYQIVNINIDVNCGQGGGGLKSVLHGALNWFSGN